MSQSNKEITKKVKIDPFYDITSRKICYEVNCPTCDNRFTILDFMNDKDRVFEEYGEFFIHCNNCGQKLGWG